MVRVEYMEIPAADMGRVNPLPDIKNVQYIHAGFEVTDRISLYYEGDDETKNAVMVECDENATEKEILEAVLAGKFYATQGPEVHIAKEGDEIVVRSSPVSRISLFSNVAWAEGYCSRGENLTEHRHRILPRERFVRAEVTDAEGRVGYTNYIVLK